MGLRIGPGLYKQVQYRTVITCDCGHEEMDIGQFPVRDAHIPGLIESRRERDKRQGYPGYYCATCKAKYMGAGRRRDEKSNN